MESVACAVLQQRNTSNLSFKLTELIYFAQHLMCFVRLFVCVDSDPVKVRGSFSRLLVRADMCV